jgi:hypothetical protein
MSAYYSREIVEIGEVDSFLEEGSTHMTPKHNIYTHTSDIHKLS